MSTTTDEHTTGDEVALPDYASAVACCGDPQPVIDELTEWLGGQTAPQIVAKPVEGEPEPAPVEQPTDQPAEDEDEGDGHDA